MTTTTTTTTGTITIPYGYLPREYQRDLFNAPANGKKRGVSVWHRRAGKDKTFLAMMAKEAMQRVGVYFYILPYYKQARKIIWEGIDKTGVPFLSVFHPSIIKHKNNQEMVIALVNGSICYFLGSDNVDALMGTNPVGIFFSEYSLHKPHVWDLMRPILVENNGFAFFNGTPRGRNHLYTLFRAAQENPEEWYCDLRSIEDTQVMTASQVEDEIKNGMARATAMQEFYCSWDAALQGAYYEEALNWANLNSQHTAFAIDPYVEVDTAWDLGIDDAMVVLLIQQVHDETRIIDMIHGQSKGLDFYAKALLQKPYRYNEHFLPHDIKVRELASGKSRLATLRDLGLTNLTVVPKAPLEDGINATRRLLYKTYIHSTNCATLLEALKSYRADYDDVKQQYGKPVHDWSSNFADALRQYAVGHREANPEAYKLPQTALGTGYDPVTTMQELQQPQRESVYDRVHSTQVFRQAAAFTPSWNPRDHTIADGFYQGV